MNVLEEYVRSLAAQLTPTQRECLVVLSNAEIARRRFGEDEFDRSSGGGPLLPGDLR
jgi:hypothetical protein